MHTESRLFDAGKIRLTNLVDDLSWETTSFKNTLKRKWIDENVKRRKFRLRLLIALKLTNKDEYWYYNDRRYMTAAEREVADNDNMRHLELLANHPDPYIAATFAPLVPNSPSLQLSPSPNSRYKSSSSHYSSNDDCAQYLPAAYTLNHVYKYILKPEHRNPERYQDLDRFKVPPFTSGSEQLRVVARRSSYDTESRAVAIVEQDKLDLLGNHAIYHKQIYTPETICIGKSDSATTIVSEHSNRSSTDVTPFFTSETKATVSNTISDKENWIPANKFKAKATTKKEQDQIILDTYQVTLRVDLFNAMVDGNLENLAKMIPDNLAAEAKLLGEGKNHTTKKMRDYKKPFPIDKFEAETKETILPAKVEKFDHFKTAFDNEDYMRLPPSPERKLIKLLESFELSEEGKLEDMEHEQKLQQLDARIQKKRFKVHRKKYLAMMKLKREKARACRKPRESFFRDYYREFLEDIHTRHKHEATSTDSEDYLEEIKKEYDNITFIGREITKQELKELKNKIIYWKEQFSKGVSAQSIRDDFGHDLCRSPLISVYFFTWEYRNFEQWVLFEIEEADVLLTV